jgi:hypothetical protein
MLAGPISQPGCGQASPGAPVAPPVTIPHLRRDWPRWCRGGLQLRRGGAGGAGGGAGRGAGMAPGVAPGGPVRGAGESPAEVPFSAPHQPRISPAPATRHSPPPPPYRVAVDPPARMGPWLPGCTLADLLSRSARVLDTRGCPMSLLPGLLWAVRFVGEAG